MTDNDRPDRAEPLTVHGDVHINCTGVPIGTLEQLVDGWREEVRIARMQGLDGYADGNSDCADELQDIIDGASSGEVREE